MNGGIYREPGTPGPEEGDVREDDGRLTPNDFRAAVRHACLLHGVGVVFDSEPFPSGPLGNPCVGVARLQIPGYDPRQTVVVGHEKGRTVGQVHRSAAQYIRLLLRWNELKAIWVRACHNEQVPLPSHPHWTARVSEGIFAFFFLGPDGSERRIEIEERSKNPGAEMVDKIRAALHP